MDVAQMRIDLKAHYGWATSWVTKVNAMPDKQVMAIYYRITTELEKAKKGGERGYLRLP